MLLVNSPNRERYPAASTKPPTEARSIVADESDIWAHKFVFSVWCAMTANT
jgi:hypothetical protein